MVGRISTFAETNYIMSIDTNVQAQEAQAETEEASSLDAQTYGGLGGSTTSLVLTIGSQVSQLTASGESATTSLANMQETYSVLGTVNNLTTSILTSLSDDISGSGNASSTVASTAATWMTQMTGLLNTQYDGAYLFSGTATNTEPVDTSDYAPTSADTPDTSYYQGASSGTTFYGANGFSVSTSVQANNSGLEMILRGISLIETAASSDSSTLSTTLSQAYSLIQGGGTEVAGTQATLSANSAALTQYQSDISTQVTTLTTLSTNLDGADIATATVMVTDLQNQLTASYDTVSKLMSDSLASSLA
jgi:flagellar hook-associated protein 3 FlgL